MTDEARQRRRTWVSGGILLMLSALVGFVARFELSWVSSAGEVLWVLGVLVFVIGLGRAGSVTRRRPVATTVVLSQLVLASTPMRMALNSLVPEIPGNPNAEEDAWGAVMFPYYVVLFAITILAVLLIGFVDALPRPWGWAPAWVFVGSGVAMVASMMMPFDDQAVVLRRILFDVPGAGILLLGVLAIILGMRTARVEEIDPLSR
ncbi:hypothetical protein [Microbacterium sp. OVT16B]|uniref:hypothetical protein n=1 Tax=Microbacterium sp. OVT16B TaxID=2862682 RepID=UPI001CBD2C02|nr:hypothetical protein [Microbacterium sp. OVT16B]